MQDLQGDILTVDPAGITGTVNMSAALNALTTGNNGLVPTALISGQTTSGNLAALNSSAFTVIRNACGSNPLFASLNPIGWIKYSVTERTSRPTMRLCHVSASWRHFTFERRADERIDP
jgi:hypothetical protein